MYSKSVSTNIFVLINSVHLFEYCKSCFFSSSVITELLFYIILFETFFYLNKYVFDKVPTYLLNIVTVTDSYLKNIKNN